MHSLYFVKLKKDQARNSLEARQFTIQLLDEHGFASSDSYFGSAKADWFVVGGRWSGELSLLQLKKRDFFGAVKKIVGGKDLTSEALKRHAKSIQALWKKHGGVGDNPYARDAYSNIGEEDDAQKITPSLIKALKKKYKEEAFGDYVECFDPNTLEEFNIKDITSESVGDWLVVIDYHN